MPDHQKVLDQFHKRLLSAVTRSSLLKSTVSRTGRLLDCSRFNSVADGLCGRVLQAVINGGVPISVDLRLRSTCADDRSEENEDGKELPDSADVTTIRENQAIYDALDRRMRRVAELVKRETGVHSLWLGYPLLYVPVVVEEDEPRRWILAPVFLWPILIQPDQRQEGIIRIGRDSNAGPAKFNRAMESWVTRHLGLSLNSLDQDTIDALTWENIGAHITSLANQFQPPLRINRDARFDEVPKQVQLRPEQGPQLFNSAVLGIFRWQNEALVMDIDRLKNMDRIDGVCSVFASGETFPNPPEIVRPKEHDRFQVFDADFSQERVIWEARREPGLVVHGPPGTGKSQTIVNIIADALAHRRTVLMVCQKYAATRVVFEKIKQVGLGGLCVEVMDTEKSRQPIFRAIRAQVDSLPTLANFAAASKRDRHAHDIERLESDLDDYVRAIHERGGPSGLAYRQMKSIEGDAYRRFPSVRQLPSLQPHLAAISEQDLESLCRDVVEAGRLFGNAEPLTNPWRYYQPAIQLTPVLGSDVDDAINRLRELDSNHVSQVQQNGAGIDLIGGLTEFLEVASQIMPTLRTISKNPQSGHSALLRAWIVKARTGVPKPLVGNQVECDPPISFAEPFYNVFYATCRGMSDDKLVELAASGRTMLEFEESWLRNVNPRFRRARGALCEVVGNADPAQIFETARQLGSEEKWVDWLCVRERNHSWLKRILDAFVAKMDDVTLIGMVDAVDRAIQRAPGADVLIRKLSAFALYLKPDALMEPEQLARAGMSISPWLDRVESGLGGLRSLKAWDHFPRRGELLNTILTVLEDYERRRLAGEAVPTPPVEIAPDKYGEWWSALVRYSAAIVWQAECHIRNPILDILTPELHAEKTRELEDLLSKKRNLEDDAIRAIWLKEQIPIRNGPWKKIFQLSGGNSKRLREAVKVGIDEGLLKLRPCWLVNPATAAEVFPLTKGLFDVVIFDEASQCPPEQALPAVYRGKTVVVSGDEKQMPPSGFNSTNWEADETDDESAEQEATDEVVPREQQLQQMGIDHLLQAESLLDAAIGNLPAKYLSVHYRSEHPALIEFSNRAFYNGRLEAPPAQVNSVNGVRPIQYHEVNGLYERRKNIDEARHVVRWLKEIWTADAKAPTIGVVTFNRPQCDLIEDLLAEECLRDASFRVRYEQEVGRKEENQDVGFFVKNLENVQGDERDVMVFSTTFGRDPAGRFFRRFGPVGAKGGWRRLNVAVTRAKQQVIILGSMPINEVSTALSANAAPGSQLTPAGYLQLYLAYAKAVSDGDEERVNGILELAGRRSGLTPTGSPESPFEEDVLGVLEKLGLTVHSQVGESGFRIDLAVVAPDPRHGYLLGIECDGATYHSDRTARLRDVWRTKILRKRRWRLHRIWSTRWWYERGEEIEALKAAVDEAQAYFAREFPVPIAPLGAPVEIVSQPQGVVTPAPLLAQPAPTTQTPVPRLQDAALPATHETDDNQNLKIRTTNVQPTIFKTDDEPKASQSSPPSTAIDVATRPRAPTKDDSKSVAPSVNLSDERQESPAAVAQVAIETTASSKELPRVQQPAPPPPTGFKQSDLADLEVAVLNIVKESHEPLMASDVLRKIEKKGVFFRVDETHVTQALAYFSRSKLIMKNPQTQRWSYSR